MRVLKEGKQFSVVRVLQAACPRRARSGGFQSGSPWSVMPCSGEGPDRRRVSTPNQGCL